MTDEISKKIKIPTDDRGYFRCQCPHCDEHFKLHVGEYLDRDPGLLNCPMCGLSGDIGDFTLTDSVREVAEAELENLAREMMNDFVDEMEKTFRGSDFVEFERGKKLRKKPVPELREFPDLAEAELLCCDAHVKVPPATASSAFTCPYCSQVVA